MPLLSILLPLLLAFLAESCYVAFMRPDVLLWQAGQDEYRHVRRAFTLMSRHNRLLLQTLRAVTAGGLLAAGVAGAHRALVWVERVPGGALAAILVAATLLFVFLLGALPYRLFGTDRHSLTKRLLAWPAVVLFGLCGLPVALLSAFTAACLRFFGIATVPPVKAARGYDLEALLRIGLEQSGTARSRDSEVRLLHNALEFSDVSVKECLVPRTEIVFVERTATLDELRHTFVSSGKSKVIVCHDDLDHIAGYVHSSSLFRRGEDWTKGILTLPAVPESMPASELLPTLLQAKRSLAVVVDEFGGTSGIVSIEDLVEEILGDIEDEHDFTTLTARRAPDGDYLLSARLEVERVNEMFALRLPESDDYTTVAGLLLHTLRRFPKNGEAVRVGDYLFKIIRATPRKIELVRLHASETGTSV
ncbi:MAG: HlyC/CorC family transporter [Bacteroidaceae bacterium]|nr:HlyC/CorC family transporter [Bacteroidaceae bacterium]